MSSFSTKTLLFFSILFFVALLGVFSYGVYAVNATQKEVRDLQVQAGAGSEGDTLVQALRTIQNNDKAELEALNNITVSKESLVTFLELLEKTGKDLGLQIKINSVTTSTDKSKSSPTVQISVTTQGNWAGTLTFTHALESLPYRVIIDSADLNTQIPTDKSAIGKEPVSWTGAYNLILYSSK